MIDGTNFMIDLNRSYAMTKLDENYRYRFNVSLATPTAIFGNFIF